MKEIKIAIAGGGPAGVYCALQLVFGFREQNFSNYIIKIFDKNEILKTILPTGHGRCNLSNSENDFREFAKAYPRGEKFLYSVFSRYFTQETLEFFEKIGIKTVEEPDGRIFPEKQSSKFVRAQMISALKKSGKVQIEQNFVKDKEKLRDFDVIVLATGSKDRCGLAKQFGHTVKPFKPALTGVVIKEKTASFPVGVSFDTPEGGVIFTHLGVSGPAIYKITSINAEKNFPYPIKLPLIKPFELSNALKNSPEKSFGNVASKFRPKSLIKYIFELYELDFDKKAKNAGQKEIEKLETLVLTATKPDNKGEIVYAGGVMLNEIDKNLKSKIYDKLYIIGEAIDVDGFCGGYNLQNCWSTGAVAAKNIIETYTQLNKN